MTTRVQMTDNFGRGRPEDPSWVNSKGETRGSRPTRPDLTLVGIPEPWPVTLDEPAIDYSEFSFWNTIRIRLANWIAPKGMAAFIKIQEKYLRQQLEWKKCIADQESLQEIEKKRKDACRSKVMVVQLDDVEIIEDE